MTYTTSCGKCTLQIHPERQCRCPGRKADWSRLLPRMKLWVDDLRDAPDNSWVEVRKVQTAISMLAHFPMEEISLDHDIENRPSDETFLPVAYYIGEKYHAHTHPKITIHSINPVGAKEIQKVLDDYGIKAEIQPYQA